MVDIFTWGYEFGKALYEDPFKVAKTVAGLGLLGLSFYTRSPMGMGLAGLSAQSTYGWILDDVRSAYGEKPSAPVPRGKAGKGVSITKPSQAFISISKDDAGGDYWEYLSVVSEERLAGEQAAAAEASAAIKAELYQVQEERARFEADIATQALKEVRAENEALKAQAASYGTSLSSVATAGRLARSAYGGSTSGTSQTPSQMTGSGVLGILQNKNLTPSERSLAIAYALRPK